MTETMMSDLSRVVTVGIDTHKDFHAVGVIDPVGRELGGEVFPATVAGYADLAVWMGSFGGVDLVGVEGTGSWGAGLTRTLTAEGFRVVEVLRPNRQERRRNGKTDMADAYAAARTAASGQHSGTPKSHDGPVESVRVVLKARAPMVRASTATMNQIKSLIDTGPIGLRETVHGLTDLRLAQYLKAKRPRTDMLDPDIATITILKCLAGHWLDIDAQVKRYTRQLDTMTKAISPRLRTVHCVGPISAATLLVCAGDNPGRLTSIGSFTALCGACPIPANSGRTQNRWRLNRGGNRQANRALHDIALARVRHDVRTRTYIEKRTADGKKFPEIMRCLKTYIAREVYPIIMTDLA